MEVSTELPTIVVTAANEDERDSELPAQATRVTVDHNDIQMEAFDAPGTQYDARCVFFERLHNAEIQMLEEEVATLRRDIDERRQAARAGSQKLEAVRQELRSTSI